MGGYLFGVWSTWGRATWINGVGAIYATLFMWSMLGLAGLVRDLSAPLGDRLARSDLSARQLISARSRVIDRAASACGCSAAGSAEPAVADQMLYVHVSKYVVSQSVKVRG